MLRSLDLRRSGAVSACSCSSKRCRKASRFWLIWDSKAERCDWKSCFSSNREDWKEVLKEFIEVVYLASKVSWDFSRSALLVRSFTSSCLRSRSS